MMEAVVRVINREFVISSKFKDEELEKLELPGVYHTELTRLLDAETLSLVADRVFEIRIKQRKLNDDCSSLRSIYCKLSKHGKKNEHTNAVLKGITKNMRTICLERVRLLNEVRELRRGYRNESNELKMVALEGRLFDIDTHRDGRESIEETCKDTRDNLIIISDEVDKLKLKLDDDLKKEKNQ